jgi:DNA helicase-2/ATP-dependent DNA helicase PcrA
VKLNKEQLKAAGVGEGNWLVVAPAGSGKTEVLVERVRRLIREGNRVLLLTFTVKAASEMLSRVGVAKAYNLGVSLVDGGTFHSFAYRVLRDHCESVGFSKGFTITNSREYLDLVGIVSRSVGINLPAKEVAAVISTSVNLGKKLEEVCLDKGFDRDVKKVVTLASKLEVYKKKFSIMTYDDLLVNLLEALKKKSVLRQVNKYDYVLVDEYQDSNSLQVEIVRALSKRSHIFVVADFLQSIYSWRGADPEGMLRYPEEFNARVLSLKENFRSTQEILDFANAVAAQLQGRVREDLLPNMFSKKRGDKPKYVRVFNEEEQARYISTDIQKLLKRRVKPKEVAVLYRVNSTGLLIENQLRADGIACFRRDSVALFEKTFVKDILALLKAATFKMDVVSWSKLFLTLKGVGRVGAAKLLEQVQKEGIKVLKDNSNTSDIYKTILKIKEVKRSVAEAVDLSVSFWKRRKTLTETETDLVRRLKAEVIDYSSIREMLADLALNFERKDDPNKVTLSSCHGAKGLGFEYVYLASVVEGRMPNAYFLSQGESLDEELRLFYVACTRPKKGLTILAPMKEDEAEALVKGERVESSESRFIKAIPNLEELAIIVSPIKKSFNREYRTVAEQLEAVRRLKEKAREEVEYPTDNKLPWD